MEDPNRYPYPINCEHPYSTKPNVDGGLGRDSETSNVQKQASSSAAQREFCVEWELVDEYYPSNVLDTD